MSNDIDPSQAKAIAVARHEARRASADRRQAELERRQHLGLSLPAPTEGTNRRERRAYRARFIKEQKRNRNRGET